MRNIIKLTPRLLKRLIKEEKEKLIKEGLLKNNKKIVKKKSKNDTSKKLQELALIERNQRQAVKIFKLLFEKKQKLKNDLKSRR